MRENQDDHISKKIKEQEAKERKFNKLDEWEKRAVIDDKKRKMELNKQWNKDHQSPYTSFAKDAAITAGIIGGANFLLHRTGLHQKINKPLAKLIRTKKAMSMKTGGTPWYRSTISDWKRQKDTFKSEWKKASDAIDSAPFRVDVKKKNSFFTAMIHARQMRENGRAIGRQAWNYHVEDTMLKDFDAKMKNSPDHNRRNKFANFIRNVTKDYNSQATIFHNLKKFDNEEDIKLAREYAEKIRKMNSEIVRTEITESEALTRKMAGVEKDADGKYYINKSVKNEFINKEAAKASTYADLLEDVNSAREHFGYKTSFTEKVKGTRKANMGDFMQNLDNIEDFDVNVVSYGDKGEKINGVMSFKQIVRENYEHAKEAGLEKEFLSITPDSMMRIGTDGKLYSAEGTETLKHDFLEAISNTLPGKIAKVRDYMRSSDQPTYNLSLKGSIDPVLAAATNNTVDSRKGSRLDNTIFKAYDKWYKIGDDGDAQEIEWMRGRYNIASGKSNFLYKQLSLMHGDARYVESDNPILHALDLREDRDEFDNKSYLGRLLARLPGNKNEFSRNNIFSDIIEPSNAFIVNHRIGLEEIKAGDNSYAYETAEKIGIISEEMRQNTYEMSDKVVEQLQSTVPRYGYAGKMLDALRETDEKVFFDKIIAIQQEMESNEESFIDKDLAAWINKQSYDIGNAREEYQVITGRTHGVIGSDFSTSYGNESLKGNALIRKKLGREALLQIAAERTGKSKIDLNNLDSLNDIFDAINSMKDVTERDKQNAKNLATSGIFDNLFDSNVAEKFGGELSKRNAEDYTNFFFDLAVNSNDRDYIKEMKASMRNVSQENFTDFDTYYATADEVGNPLQYNSNIAIHKTTGVLDVLKSLNDTIFNGGNSSNFKQDVDHLFGQFFAGRDSMQDVSYGTVFPFFALTRLNEVGRVFGIGFSARSMGSTTELLSNIMLKRVIPVSIGATYLDFGNDTSQEITGQSFTGAALRGMAQTDVMLRRGMDAIGLTDWLKEEKKINPIMQYWGDKNEFYNADELQDYYDNGYTPVRKGAYWTFGSVNELRGGEISYWAPTWVRKAESDYKDKALYDGMFDKWSHSFLPTPINPISPIFALLDPYHLEEEHSEDRPYAVSGQLFDEGTPLGIMLNPVLGDLIKPQKELHPFRVRNGVDIYSALYEANEWIKDKAASIGKRNYFTYDGADVGAVTFNAWNAPSEDSSVMSMNIGGGQYGSSLEQVYGVYDNQDGSVNEIYAQRSGEVSVSGIGLRALHSIGYDSGVPSYLKGTNYTKLTKDNIGAVATNSKLDKDHAIVAGIDNSLGYVAREDKRDIISKDGRLDLADSLKLDAIINNEDNLIVTSNTRKEAADLINIIKHPISLLSLGNKAIKDKAASKMNVGGMDDFDDSQGFLSAQKLKGFAPSQGMELLNDADTVAELINSAKGSSLVHEAAVSERLITGIYGYMSGEMFGIGTDREKKVATSQDMTSTSRTFWDSGIGGAGGSTAEIIRRFIPDFRRRTRINPMLNTMPDWLPERFKTGDPYTQIIDGEARLPGKGYEALNKLHSDAYGEYGAFDRFKILADIAPFSPEYKLWKQIAAKTVSDPHLIKEMDEIRDRVSQQGKKHDFYNNNLLDSGVVYKDVVVGELLGYGKFKSGNQVYKLAGISIKSNENESMQDVLGKYLRIGDKVTIAIDKNESYRTNKDTQSSINAAVYRDGENVNKLMIDSGDATIRKGDKSAPAFLSQFSATQRVVAAISELIGHVDIPWLSDQYLRIRSPLESYDAEVLYGTPYQTWSHPIDTFLVPAITRAFHDTTALSIIPSYLFNIATEKPGITKLEKTAATALYMFSNRGAFVGGALGSIMGFRQSTIENGARLGQMIAFGGHVLTGGNSYLDEGSAGAVLGYEVAKRLEKSKTKGAVIGLAASTAYRFLFGEKGTWKTDYIKKKWDLEEYFDRLTYIKYEALYHAAAKKAKEEEDVDVEEIVKNREDQFQLSKQIRSRISAIQKSLKAEVYDKESDESSYLKKKLQAILNKVDMSGDEIFEGGEWTRAALLYRKAAKATVYAMNSNTTWAQMISALPRNDREYFMEFVKERDPDKREEILDHVSPSLNKALRLAWKMKVDKQKSNEDYFETHNLPTPYWAGWDPNNDIDDIQVKTVANEGMNLSDFGYYESQLEDDDNAAKTPPINHWNNKNQSAEDVKANLKRILQARGLKNLDISVEPTIGATNIIASIKKWAGMKENQERIDDEIKNLTV